MIQGTGSERLPVAGIPRGPVESSRRGGGPNSWSTLAQNHAMQWTRGHRHAWWRSRGPRAIDRGRSMT